MRNKNTKRKREREPQAKNLLWPRHHPLLPVELGGIVGWPLLGAYLTSASVLLAANGLGDVEWWPWSKFLK